MTFKKDLLINININNYELLIGFTIQFLIINFINILFGYYVLLPLMNKKYKNTFSNSLNIVSKLEFFNLKDKDSKKDDEHKNKYLKVTLTFLLKLVIILLSVNFFIFITKPYNYLLALKQQLQIKTFIKLIIITILILLIQLLYFNNFTFSYYLNLILKYIL